ncbi:D-arabinose 1-dehydrogenase-like Zn-dependent alcohol dehydrogenase, partial [Auritidibacter ignavus]|nr:D-arabinose 1-dehydrogenase-like Zn-dependent alcohol dehydrogenase [Auritidibacter ignavus]
AHLSFSKLITNRYRFDQIDQAYQDLANRKIRGRGVVQIGGEHTRAM